MESINTNELKELLATSDINLLDVREADEYAESHIDQAHLVPLSTFPEAMNDLDKDAKYYLICRSGRRSQQAGMMMELHGFTDVVNVEGGNLAFND